MTASGSAILLPIPEGYHSLTPWIISRHSARLIEFLSAAFGAVEIARVGGSEVGDRGNGSR
jgi:hypothetical protein